MDGSYRTTTEHRPEPAPADLRRKEQSPAELRRARQRVSGDPYAPPKMHKDNTGGLVRGGVLALLLAGAAVGSYFYMQGADERVPLGQEATELQAPADNFAAASYPQADVNDGAALQAPMAPQENVAPASETPIAAPAPRRATARPAPAPEPVPPPIVQSTTPPPVVSAPPSTTITPVVPSEEPGLAPM
jgi:hypothetical protein